MKVNYFIISIILVILCFPIAQGLGVNGHKNIKEGKPSETIVYEFSAINTQQYPVDINITIETSNNYNIFVEEEVFFRVLPNHQVLFRIFLVIPHNIQESSLNFSVSLAERPSLENNNELMPIIFLQYQKMIFLTFQCIIEHTPDEGFSHDHLLLFAIPTLLLTTSLLGLVALHRNGKIDLSKLISSFGSIHIPLIPLYTRLRRDRLLNNETRKDIMNYIDQHKKGVSFSELLKELNISYPSFLNYHLRRLKEFNLIKCIDNTYYSQGTPLKRPFITEIREAMISGARTPTEVANEIRSYPQKVRYHMQKHGLLNACDIDYDKRRQRYR